MKRVSPIPAAQCNIVSFCGNSYLILIICALALFTIFGCKKDLQTTGLSHNTQSTSKLVTNKPNIILINMDDVGMEIPNFNGGRSCETPNLNFIASSSINFTEARALPVCSPSRVELMTGKYNFRNYTNWAHLDPTSRTVANVLHDGGYTTCFSGKWDIASIDYINIFGFDRYMTLEHNSNLGSNNYDSLPYHIYKDPSVLTNDIVLPDSITKGKYGQDLLTNFVADFIDSNLSRPFFIYWAPNLVHKPFSPTPDEPEFASWDPDKPEEPGDTVFFRPMVKYMDKLIGSIFTKIENSPVANNTIIIITADNGTSNDIYTNYRGIQLKGGKGSTLETGIRVPLLVYWNGHVRESSDADLIDICDILPTLADLSGTQEYLGQIGIIDGISFAPRINGTTGPKRTWSFAHFQPYPVSKVSRWILNGEFKRYDSTWLNESAKQGFYKISGKNYLEKSPVPDDQMTTKEQAINTEFKVVLSEMHN